MYTPISLPPLPRDHCPYRIYTIYDGDRVKSVPCPGQPDHYGWCSQHQYVLNFLIAGYVLDFPVVQINEYRRIDAGICSWEQDAIRLHADLTWLVEGRVRHKNIYEEVMQVLWPLIASNEASKARYLALRSQVFAQAA